MAGVAVVECRHLRETGDQDAVRSIEKAWCPAAPEANQGRCAIAEISPRSLELVGRLIEQLDVLREPTHQGGLVPAEMARNDVHGRSSLPRSGRHVEHNFARHTGKCVRDALGGGTLVVKQGVAGTYLRGIWRSGGWRARVAHHAEKRIQDAQGRFVGGFRAKVVVECAAVSRTETLSKFTCLGQGQQANDAVAHLRVAQRSKGLD